ncbi:hypothetical protein [Aliarcobacter cryaerophilus]|uniref:DUF4062 domain-containing protein n=1 Tax=Aliarcobacter cryaerophilus TaxID=28198 RepID=A0A5C0E3U0_9BACT|nr:hypothetical protein [Aliarcobacter cryaerophilus]QEI46239.1 DUF4062 domain-containing protein [Aliarcobacter cryaerophilus]
MSQNKFINVMISSRNSVVFDGKELSSIRSEIKRRIETTEIFGKNYLKFGLMKMNQHKVLIIQFGKNV